MNRVLVIEDSPDAFALIRQALGTSYQLEWVKSVAEATHMIEKRGFDVLLLDIGLPDGDGFKFCSVLRTDSDLKNVPVIILTARTSVADKILGFSVGADDFIQKPFEPLELKARVDAKIRRTAHEKDRARLIRVGEIEINTDSQKVSVSSEGQSTDIDLTPIEFKILLLLAKQEERVFSRDEVLEAVWGSDIHVYSRSVDTHVSKLRKKLGLRSSCIQSVHGAGYRFVTDHLETSSDRIEASLFGQTSKLVSGSF